ncbi:ATP-binding protein [Robbsia sp. Bb-Pol-6]|uniref:histidine kinase n=1 Tax=Robbsia betulipollinis TaxID=2981849 RepID=A0ABT3ZGX4_9BURK|nr:ATP-binding protein [Robbsia betulipollinis]MCY0385781.1 ATP-binding protein [Robbsia betulipollinis]
MTTKLFVIMVVVNIMLIGAMALGARISFETGFLGYLTKQDVKRLEASTAPLAAAYRQHGSWAFLQQNRHLWHQLMRPTAPSSNASFPPLPIADLIGASVRFTLLDTDGKYLSGNQNFSDNAPRRPIVVDRRTVGWLLIVPVQKVTEAGDLRLQQEQRDASWTLAVIATLLAILISLWLARALGMPLQRIARATHALAGGDFQARVPIESGGELGQLESDFNHLAQALERIEKMRASLVADVSHELRTPLAVMRGEVEALEVGIRPMTQDAMHSLSVELQRLNRLVDDLYHLSLSEAGALRYYYADIDVVDAFDDILPLIERQLADAGITLDAEFSDSPCWVRGDERRLQQVFSNVFQNVFRYVPAGERVHLRIGQDARHVRIDVQDSGPGVPEASLEALFGKFYRVERSRSRATGGAGLGLPICRSIVEAHEGRITAAKAPQGGLWIAIVLPRQKDPS